MSLCSIDVSVWYASIGVGWGMLGVIIGKQERATSIVFCEQPALCARACNCYRHLAPKRAAHTDPPFPITPALKHWSHCVHIGFSSIYNEALSTH